MRWIEIKMEISANQNRFAIKWNYFDDCALVKIAQTFCSKKNYCTTKALCYIRFELSVPYFECLVLLVDSGDSILFSLLKKVPAAEKFFLKIMWTMKAPLGNTHREIRPISSNCLNSESRSKLVNISISCFCASWGLIFRSHRNRWWKSYILSIFLGGAQYQKD